MPMSMLGACTVLDQTCISWRQPNFMVECRAGGANSGAGTEAITKAMGASYRGCHGCSMWHAFCQLWTCPESCGLFYPKIASGAILEWPKFSWRACSQTHDQVHFAHYQLQRAYSNFYQFAVRPVVMSFWRPCSIDAYYLWWRSASLARKTVLHD